MTLNDRLTLWYLRLRNRTAELDKAAFALPVLLLVSLALVNLALLGFAAVNAGNAAEYGACIGSVALSDPAGGAHTAALAKVGAVRVGSYMVSISGGGRPAACIEVAMICRVPNYLKAGLAKTWLVFYLFGHPASLNRAGGPGMAGVVGSYLVLLWIAEIKRMVARVAMQKGGKVGTKRLEKALEISINEVCRLSVDVRPSSVR